MIEERCSISNPVYVGDKRWQVHKKKQTLAIRQPVSVTVQRLKIQRADSIKYLDVAKLSRAVKAEFELGHIKIKGRSSTVRAVVRKGMVVGNTLRTLRRMSAGKTAT